MTTATALYTIRHDATEETYAWEVVDADGDLLDSFETRAEAKADVKAREAADREERDEEEAADLRLVIAERAEDLSLSQLKALAAFLGL